MITLICHAVFTPRLMEMQLENCPICLALRCETEVETEGGRLQRPRSG